MTLKLNICYNNKRSFKVIFKVIVKLAYSPKLVRPRIGNQYGRPGSKAAACGIGAIAGAGFN